jgi:hypothetical protein
MTHDVAAQSYRGVLCLSCRQPIPLPSIVLNMELSRKSQESDLGHDYPDRVFSLRCRACDREKPYRSSDIVDFEGTPASRRPRSIHERPKRPANTLTRAANG